jgi:hypothetical protein
MVSAVEPAPANDERMHGTLSHTHVPAHKQFLVQTRRTVHCLL